MNFDIEYIEKLAKIITDTSLTEISIEDGDQAITLRKDLPPVTAISAPVPSISTPAPIQTAAPVQAAPSVETHKGNPITSPMVGTFYSAPSPDAAPFVKAGDEIKKGTKVCIIEAMKLMNEIESEFEGKVTEICVSDGQPVEFGQVLMYVE